jgi:hypothetical protein
VQGVSEFFSSCFRRAFGMTAWALMPHSVRAV